MNNFNVKHADFNLSVIVLFLIYDFRAKLKLSIEFKIEFKIEFISRFLHKF